MWPETRLHLVKKIFFHARRSEGLKKKDFSRWGGNKKNRYAVMKDMIARGIIRENKAVYKAVTCRFTDSHYLAEIIKQIRKGDEELSYQASRYLLDACKLGKEEAMTNAMLLEGVHVIATSDLRKFFLNFLDGRIRVQQRTREKVFHCLLACIEHIKSHEDEDLLATYRQTVMERVEALAVRERNSNVVNTAFNIMRELEISEDDFIDLIKKILKKHGGRLGSLEGVIYAHLQYFERQKVRYKLLGWAKSKSKNLKTGSTILCHSF